MSQKASKIIGWTLSILLAFMFTMSAVMKLTQNETAVVQATSVGIDATTYMYIGIVEIVSLVLFLIPRTGVIGSLLLIAYMGGAIATHLQHGQPIIMAVVFQIVLWIAALLRFPELKERVIGLRVKG